MIKAVIFDVGGVIIDFSEEKYLTWLSKKIGIDYERADKVIEPLIKEMESGRLKLRDAERIFSKKLDLPLGSLMWTKGFSETASPSIEVVNILKDLSKNYKIGVITNVSFSRYYESRKLVLKSLILKKFIKEIIASCYFGVRKPDERIFKEMLRRLKVNPEEAVFIDNQIENVEGAAKLGIHAILFTNADKLKEDLKDLGIKVD